MTTRHTEKLLKLGKERKRLTKQLQDALARIADQIAESVPLDTQVRVAGRTYRTFEVASNIEAMRYLGIDTSNTHWLAFCNYVSAGESYYIHNDLGARVDTAGRGDWLHFANNLPKIIEAFEIQEQDIINALRDAFTQLKKMTAY